MENNSVFVLLAGGKSSRMGVAKGLLQFEKTFWVLHQLERISKSNCKEVILGLGYDYEHYFMAIPWLENAQREPYSFLNTNVKVVVNPTPAFGQFSTLQRCLKKVENADSILISPVDTPIDTPEKINKLLEADADLAHLTHAKKHGHPIKISIRKCTELLDVEPDTKEARLDFQLKKTSPARVSEIETTNRDCLINFNTPSEWKAYVASYKLRLQ